MAKNYWMPFKLLSEFLLLFCKMRKSGESWISWPSRNHWTCRGRRPLTRHSRTTTWPSDACTSCNIYRAREPQVNTAKTDWGVNKGKENRQMNGKTEETDEKGVQPQILLFLRHLFHSQVHTLSNWRHGGKKLSATHKSKKAKSSLFIHVRVSCFLLCVRSLWSFV